METNKMTMKNLLSTIFFVGLTALVFVGCKKLDRMYFSPVTTIDKMEIIDLTPVTDSIFLVLCKDKDEKREIYRCTWGKNQKVTSTKMGKSFSLKFNTIEFKDGKTWIGGDTLAIRMSEDTGKTWVRWRTNSFDNWKENWPGDISNLTNIYIKNDEPYFAIGSDDLFKGNFYWFCTEWNSWKSGQKQFGLNDMIVCDDSLVYIAGYGSICYANQLGENQTLENVGGENFTSICSNGKYVFACSYSGKIFRTEMSENKWEKVSSKGTRLLFIEADNNGNVVAVGESKKVLISNDNGETWREESYSEGNKISCMEMLNNEFYIGTEKGVIIKLNNANLNL